VWRVRRGAAQTMLSVQCTDVGCSRRNLERGFRALKTRVSAMPARALSNFRGSGCSRNEDSLARRVFHRPSSPVSIERRYRISDGSFLLFVSRVILR
jgi:hypothetical protein